MQCPRCNTEVPERASTCPVCHKALTPQNAGAMRIALTGEVVAVPPPISVVPGLPPSSDGPPSPSVPVKVLSANPAFQAALRQPDPPQTERLAGHWRWLMMALVGCFFLLWVLFALYPPAGTGMGSSIRPDGTGTNPDVYSYCFFLYRRVDLYVLISLGLAMIRIMPPPRSWRRHFLLGPYHPIVGLIFFLTLIPLMWSVSQYSSDMQAAFAHPSRQTRDVWYRQRNRNNNRADAASRSILYLVLIGYGTWWLLTRPQNLIGQPGTACDTEPI